MPEHSPLPPQEWQARLTPDLYRELKALARSHLRRERVGHTLGTTALVHEAWLRLSRAQNLAPEDASRFFAVASNTMRRVLVDHARKVKSAKRGSGGPQLSVDDVEEFLTESDADEVMALDDALERLELISARAAQVVVSRFFGGLSEQETAEALGISLRTVQRDWLMARAWLRREVARDLGLADLPDSSA
jgi:RNA polymerase sigma factor (TIGR02999 family)